MTRDDHDPRCERSTTKRCRCDCQGRLHGDQASQIDLEHAHQAAVLGVRSPEAEDLRIHNRRAEP